jgi:hypothetical protein
VPTPPVPPVIRSRSAAVKGVLAIVFPTGPASKLPAKGAPISQAFAAGLYVAFPASI